jgi:hypothetical protein
LGNNFIFQYRNTGIEAPVLRYFGIMKKSGNTGIPVSVLPVLDALFLQKSKKNPRITDRSRRDMEFQARDKKFVSEFIHYIQLRNVKTNKMRRHWNGGLYHLSKMPNLPELLA